MGPGEDWLETLALAGVPSFLCRCDAGRMAIVARTPQFGATIGGIVDEQNLIDRLAAALPDDATEATTVVSGGGGPGWECVIKSIDGDAGTLLGIVRVPTAAQLRNESFFRIVERLPVIIARIDRQHRHTYINSTIESVTGLSAQRYLSKTNRQLGMPENLIELWKTEHDRVFATGEGVEREFEFPGLEGSRWYLFRVIPEFDATGEVRTVLSTARDITELKLLQEQLTELAQTDSLTALLNRRSFLDRLDAELVRARNQQARLSLLLLDVDDFKSINDRFGHPGGDNVLQTIGSVLREETGAYDFAGRLGGDEFGVGLVGADPEFAQEVSDRIRRRIGELAGQQIGAGTVKVSIGMATAEASDRRVSDLIARVDQSMYSEKSPGSLWMQR